MVVIPSILVVVIAPGAVTDLGLETDPEVVTDLAQAVETDPEAVTDQAQAVETDLEVVTNPAQVVVVIDPALEQDLARDRSQAQEAVAEIDPVPEQDLALARNRVQVQDQVRVTEVPLVARARVEGLHRETVNVVHPVVPVNHAQEVHRAEVVVDVAAPVVVVVDAVVAVAEVVVADVDVDLI